MLIDLSEVLSVEERKLNIQADIDMERFESIQGSYAFVRKEPVAFSFENKDKKVFNMDADIHCSLNIPCDRCLEDVKIDFDIKVSKEIDLNKSKQDCEDEYPFIEGSSLNVDRFVYNEILVNLPMKVLCSEDCKGICNRCGANLNSQTCNCETKELDPRMSKILDVFNNFKEV